MRQVEGYRETLRSPEKGAYFHIWDEARQRFERKLLWGVGNGWAAAGMTRVIRALPDTMKSEKDRIVGYVRELLDACLKFQRPDGLFHDVLDDPSTFVETNAGQMFAYAIYRGVRAGGWRRRTWRPPTAFGPPRTRRSTGTASSRGSAGHRTSIARARRPRGRPSSS